MTQGVPTTSDHWLLTEQLREGNLLADLHAKEAVEEHRVPLNVRKAIKAEAYHAAEVAQWVGIVTCVANDGSAGRDSTAGKAKVKNEASADGVLRLGSGLLNKRPDRNNDIQQELESH